MKLPIGLGLVECADYNKGNPYFIEFRLLLHSPYKLSDTEAKKLKKETPVLRLDMHNVSASERNKASKASAHERHQTEKAESPKHTKR